jgi:hypothetical protein
MNKWKWNFEEVEWSEKLLFSLLKFWKILINLFISFVGVNLFSSTGALAVKCSLKAYDGYLFPLDRSFFFVHKPTTHIRFIQPYKLKQIKFPPLSVFSFFSSYVDYYFICLETKFVLFIDSFYRFCSLLFDYCSDSKKLRQWSLHVLRETTPQLRVVLSI